MKKILSILLIISCFLSSNTAYSIEQETAYSIEPRSELKVVLGLSSRIISLVETIGIVTVLQLDNAKREDLLVINGITENDLLDIDKAFDFFY